MSICTGAFVLAAAGLLDGRPATTHWRYADDLRALYPQVLVDENVLFVDDGDVLTSAGLAAGIDLCLHLIRQDHGTQVANAVARYCVVPPWREGGQAQFIESRLSTDDFASTAAARTWASQNLREPLTIRQLAQRAGMSPRTFIRRFREETGQSPGLWVRNRRIDRARELLEGHDLSVDEVARQSGSVPAAICGTTCAEAWACRRRVTERSSRGSNDSRCGRRPVGSAGSCTSAASGVECGLSGIKSECELQIERRLRPGPRPSERPPARCWAGRATCSAPTVKPSTPP